MLYPETVPGRQRLCHFERISNRKDRRKRDVALGEIPSPERQESTNPRILDDEQRCAPELLFEELQPLAAKSSVHDARCV